MRFQLIEQSVDGHQTCDYELEGRAIELLGGIERLMGV
ncbi:hypothetical protein SEA_FULCRUM_44 [Gordonia phage Fulcrum]|uniref:Uncharacterized protein n=1 Tax=Gordonia phage Fulcrum TaxID=3077818 RepID=A0AA96KME2_9CAUD|nr:hypothetical protein SEA_GOATIFICATION_44 [Gordonia phage GOATification]WNO27158.1 hypothetical protein SEA_FULCRUM_44 [Gordonia phage Fulcrum]